MKSKDLQMHSATLEKQHIGSQHGGEPTPPRRDDGFRVFVGIERSGCAAQLCSILDRSGVHYGSIDNVEQLQQALSSTQHGLAVISLGFWGNGAKHLFESQLDSPPGVQFALWVGDQPVDIDRVVEGIRLGAVAVIHGESCEARLLLLIKESQARAANMSSASEPKYDRTNAPIANGGDNSSTCQRMASSGPSVHLAPNGLGIKVQRLQPIGFTDAARGPTCGVVCGQRNKT